MTGGPDDAAHLTPALSPAWPERAAWGTAPLLRAWQTAAMRQYVEQQPRDFLAVATPGAGKTTFALSVAADLLGRRLVDRITVVAPTEHLKLQWAEAAARAGIPIDPTYSAGKGKTSQDFVGIAVTYAGVAVNPLAMRIRTERFKTLVILDEVHHAGDALSWGEGVREAFEPAARRLALTGTPFRSDVNPIPFVTYAPGPDGIPRSVADFTYGYAHALADHVVRPVLFMAYSGEMQWRTRAGDEIQARLGEPLTKDLTAQALRTALDPAGSWVPSVLAAADSRLTEVRRHVPDAGGLVIASDQDSARAYAKTLRQISGEPATVVLSDEKASSKKITDFTDSDRRWMVAVRMVSEGVDVPRLAVGVYATTTSTPALLRPGRRPLRACPRSGRDGVGVPAVGPEAAGLRLRDGGRAGPRAGPPDHRRGRHLRRRAGADRPGQRGGVRLGRARHELRGDRLGGPLRPGALRRRRVRPRGGGARRLRGGDGLPRHPRAARAGPDARAAPAAPERPGEEAEGGRPATRTRSPRCRPTSSWPCSAGSSTGSSPRGTTAPARRTASPTPRCARSAADRPRRSPVQTSCTPGSTGSGSGPRARPPEAASITR